MGVGSSMPETGQHKGPPRVISRRTVARGAAWSAPLALVAVGAPAFATSRPPCQVQTNFDNLEVGTRPTMLTFLPSTITASIAYSSTGNGGDNTPGGTSEVAQTTTNPAWKYIEVEMLKTLTAGDKVTVTITFTQAVSNLSFRIHDIDAEKSDGDIMWVDHVVVNTSGFTYSRGTDVTGTGTTADPFRNTKFVDQAIDSGKNHVDLTWAGAVTQISFTYKAGADGKSSNQHIGIGNLSFTDCVANPNGFAAGPPADRLAVARGSFATGASRVLVEGRDN